MANCVEKLSCVSSGQAAISYRIEFSHQPFFNNIFYIQTATSLAVAILFIMEASNRVSAAPSLGKILVLTGAIVPLVVAMSCLLRFLTWRRQPLPIEFTETGLRLPHSIASNRVSELPYGQVASLDIRKLLFGRFLVIAGIQRSYIYPIAAFAMPSSQLPEGLALGFRSFALGRPCLERFRTSQRLVDALLACRTVGTHALLALLVCIFGVVWLTGSLDNVAGLTILGANVANWVWHGEVGRLFTASFLHLNSIHLYVNVIALASFGGVLERLIGTRKFLIVYLLSALAGSLTTALFGAALLSVGASGAVFGVLGALAVVNWRLAGQLPPGFAQTRRWWVAIVGMNVALSLIAPAIDWRAHIGGFAGGALVAYCLLRSARATRDDEGQGESTLQVIGQWREAQGFEKWALSILMTMFASAALVIALQYPARAQQVERLLTELKADPETSESLANFVAWSIVQRSESTTTHLELAQDMMLPSIAAILGDRSSLLDKTKAAHLDTYASLLFRLGEYRQAAVLERKVLMYGYKPSYSSQYARFLHAHFDQSGVLLLGEATSEDVALLRGQAVDRPTGVKLLRTSAQGPLAVTVSVSKESVRLGYFLCQFETANELDLVANGSVFGHSLVDLVFAIQMIDAENINPSSVDRCLRSRVDGIDWISP